MVKVTDLKCCSDCGTVYYGRFSKDVCPNCSTNLNEKVTGDSHSGHRSLDV